LTPSLLDADPPKLSSDTRANILGIAYALRNWLIVFRKRLMTPSA
jgi:hypothetical protein